MGAFGDLDSSERTDCGITVLTPEEAATRRRRETLLPAILAKKVEAKPCSQVGVTGPELQTASVGARGWLLQIVPAPGIKRQV